jgi:NAD(P)H-hydrate repair Nnr-like enzyme with NAD(P)H-hydrate dehydratase domain
VVLKGAGSVIGLPSALAERYVINPTGSPALASAGTGDVLAGMIGSLLAQLARGGAPASKPQSLVQAVLAAVWLHGQAADDFGASVGLSASDIAPLAARALSRLRAAASAQRAGAGR